MGMDSKKKVQDVKLTDDNFRENPYNTKFGQEVVSISETFWTRLAREGRPMGRAVNNTTLPNTGVYTFNSISPSVDCLFYPRYISVSATVDAELLIQITTNIPQLSSFYAFRGYAKAGTPILIEFDGDICISGSLNGQIAFGAINTGASAGILIGNIFGYEVNVNA